MQNTERQKFEENWKSAFDGAEMTPPDGVWNSIELDLAAQESAVMKKRVVFYQRVAAGLLLVSVMTGMYAFWQKDVGGEREIAGKEVKRTEEQIKSNVELQKERGVEEQQASKPVVVQARQIALSVTDDEDILKSTETTEPTVLTGSTEVEELKPEETKPEETTAAETTVAVASPLLQNNPAPEEIIKPAKKTSRESTLWLALGASAGNYTPNTPTATMTATSNFDGPTMSSFVKAAPPPQKKPEPKVGQSYSVGMLVGKKFGRVVLQTGVALAKQQIEYTSNYDTRTPNNSARAASFDYLATDNSSALSFTNEYNVNSTMEILSIPVQVGYMIIDRKLGWQFNAGVSPDFFLRNVLTDESGQRERMTQSAGSGSPYRSLNWSGLLNTELSYRIGTHYRLSLVPGVRYSFNSILKEPTSNGRPVILDVGFRFKYLFD